MKVLWLFLLATVAIAMFSGTALAQGDSSFYFVTYYANNVSGAPDGTVRFINDGDTGGNSLGFQFQTSDANSRFWF